MLTVSNPCNCIYAPMHRCGLQRPVMHRTFSKHYRQLHDAIMTANVTCSDWTEYLINKKPCPYVCTYTIVFMNGITCIVYRV